MRKSVIVDHLLGIKVPKSIYISKFSKLNVIPMSLFDLLREERIKGKVLDKYKYDNGNLGIIVEDERTGKRYSVEFRTNYTKSGWENLYKIISEPFKSKREYLDQLIEKDTYIDLSTSYSKDPIKYAYNLHAVSSRALYQVKRPQEYRRIAYKPVGGL